jgi:ABC-type transport system involved in cytochrome c biogenesis permease component
MSPVKPYLVPSGLLMMLVGIAYLGVSLGTVSDQPFITLVRRELASYFFSSIAYFVMFGIAFISWFGYWLFLGTLHEQSRAGEAVQEPILQGYIPGSLFGPLCVIMLVPAITMRLFSEEKRSGTLEVLLTAPLSEASITFSKILAAWLFYMVCWIPMGLYLIAIRVEGDQPFDYRPMLSLYIAIGASGFAFIAMGAFFSSLTNNQIVAAVMTFVGMLLLFVLRWHTFLPIPLESVRSALAAVASASYWPLWAESLRGQLLVRDLALQLSMGVFWTYLTLKSLEARKWG